MNIIRGLDRIALVLAILAIVPGFFLAGRTSYEGLKDLSPEYKEWRKEFNKRVEYLKQKMEKPEKRRVPYFPSYSASSLDTYYYYDLREYYEWDDITLKNIWAKRPQTYKYPHPSQTISIGIVGAVLSFMVVLFGIRGTSRGIKRFSLWIIEGFREEKQIEDEENSRGSIKE